MGAVAAFTHPFVKDQRWKRVRRGLTSLATRGVDPYWIIERMPTLLDFEVVKAKALLSELSADAFDCLPRSFSDVLREIAEGFRHDYRLMLHIVLGFDEVYTDDGGKNWSLLDMSANERHTLAGRVFRGKRGVVGPDTIRLNHLPPSLDRMAVELLRQEMEHTGFWPLGTAEPLGPNPEMPRNLPGDPVLQSGLYDVHDVEGRPLGRPMSLVKGDEFPPVSNGVEFGWKLQPDATS
jgi:hypothetical protein